MSAKKVLVFGGSGILGGSLLPALKTKGVEVLAPTHAECDLTDLHAIERVLSNEFDAVINAAALINVDEIEKEPREAFAVNARAAGHMAKRLAGRNIPYVYISTHYVFGDAKEAYREDDERAPMNKYGESKAEGERLVKEAGGTYYIVRTSWLYGGGTTFVDKVVQELQQDRPYSASEQCGNPTYAADLAAGIVGTFLDGKKASGVYHLINGSEGTAGVSRGETVREIARILQKSTDLIQKAPQQKVFNTRRPEHAVLLSTKLPPLRDWREALKEYIEERYGGR